jgi:hypothetical protein
MLRASEHLPGLPVPTEYLLYLAKPVHLTNGESDAE